MFNIRVNKKGNVELSGRFDEAHADQATKVFNSLNTSADIDFKDLQYISSTGLGILLATQKRLLEKGNRIRLVNMSNHLKDVFHFARFDTIFEIS